jgi:hypothetical protein
MMWDQVMESVLALLQANEVLSEIFGESFRMAAGGSKLQVPSCEYTILSDVSTEIMEPMLVQLLNEWSVPF